MVYVTGVKNIEDKFEIERIPKIGENCLISIPPKLNHDNNYIENSWRTAFGSFKKYDEYFVTLSDVIIIPVKTRLKQLGIEKTNIRQANALISFYNDLREKKFPKFELEKSFYFGNFPYPNGIEIYLIQYQKEAPDRPIQKFC